jgi:hypothetical protein
MIKGLVLAASLHQFMALMHRYKLNPKEYRLVRNWWDMNGWWIDKPVFILEGYQYNRDYTVELMWNVGERFENIGFITEEEIWNENPII